MLDRAQLMYDRVGGDEISCEQKSNRFNSEACQVRTKPTNLSKTYEGWKYWYSSSKSQR